MNHNIPKMKDYKNNKVKQPSLLIPILEGIAFSSVVIMCVVIYFVLAV